MRNDLLERLIDVFGDERLKIGDLAVVEAHQDHLVGAARPGQEFRHVEGRLDALHLGQGLGGWAAVRDMIDDVMIRAAFDHVEVALPVRA